MSKARNLAVLGVPLGGRGIKWLLRDEFLTNDAAPLDSPRPCEPGPGSLTIVNPGNSWFIASGELNYIGATAWTSYAITTSSSERIPGRAVLARQDAKASCSSYVGWANTSPPPGNRFTTEGFLLRTDNSRVGVLLLPHAGVDGQYYLIAVVLRSAGAFYFVRDPGDLWRLWFVTVSDTSSNLYAGFDIFHAVSRKLDWLRIRDLPAPFNTDYGIATLHETTAVSGTAYTGVADAIIDLTVTAPNPLANTCELRYRVLDDQNYWTAYFDSAGAFKLDSVSGGTATNRISVAGVIAAGQTQIIRVICRGTKHACYTLAGATWTWQGSEIDISHQDTQTTIKPVAGTGWVLGQLDCWPRQSPYYAELDRV